MSLEKIINQFDSFNYYLDRKINNDIEEYRKGQFVINFKDENGCPIDDVQVSVKQKSHEFKFGCTLFFLDQFEDSEKNTAYRELFKDIFNYAVVPLYWDTLEPTKGKPRFDKDCEFVHRRPPLDSIMEYCNEHNIRTKGHCLIYNSFQPAWLSDSNRQIKIDIDRRLKALSDRYCYDFEDVDVINEMLTIYKNCYKGNGCRNLQITDELDHEEWCFDICRKYFPHSKLFWNEGLFESFGEHYRGHRSFYYMTLRHFLEHGVKIEGIGMQYHAYTSKENAYEKLKEVCNPLRVLDVMDCYSKFDLPIHISEVSIPSYSNEPEDEELQAELTKRLYRLWFSSKKCESIVWWNFADQTAFGDENRFHAGLIRRNCSLKSSYKVLDELINKEWHTSFDTAVNGTLRFSGFYGDYEVTAVHNGKKVTKDIRLFKENTGYNNKFCDFRSVDVVL